MSNVIVEAFLATGVVGKVVFGLLLLFSVTSWTVIIGKWLYFGRVSRDTRKFKDTFARTTKFSELNTAAAQLSTSPLSTIYSVGYEELQSQFKLAKKHSKPLERVLGAIERSMKTTALQEQAVLSRGLFILATTAATTPFIGLFGTVWGIMIAFTDISRTGSASIVAVAPGIAEALVNTAAGLGAAVPALIFYNYFSFKIRGYRRDMEDFILTFLNLAERLFE